MSRELGTLYISILCENCGFTEGTPEGENLNRCADCGQYATDDPDVCCTEHEVRTSPYPSGICPRCEQEQDRRAREQEMHQRRANPRMHSMVDAKRF